MKKALAVSLATALAGLYAVPLTAAQEGPPPAKPAAEHVLLSKDVGTWDASVTMWMAPGQPPAESKGTETVSMAGPFWQVSHFEGTMMGEPFKGLGLVGWDPQKKVYVSSWVDSTWPGISHGTSTYDAAKRTASGTMDTIGPDGKPMKTNSMVHWPSDDERIFTMSSPGPDGKEMKMMEIRYTRRK